MRFTAIACLLILCVSFTPSAEGNEISDSSGAGPIESLSGKISLCFIENQGQLDEDVCYYIQGSDKTLYFTESGIVISLVRRIESGDNLFHPGLREPDSLNLQTERYTIKLNFENARKVKPAGQQKQPSQFSYFKGKPENWKTGCPAFGKVVYHDLWPGIDLVYTGTVNKLKYDFIVNPGADPKAIGFTCEGASAMRIDDEGGLVIETPLGNLEDSVPYAYQNVGGTKSEVPVRFILREADSLGFEVGEYDRQKPLILDPAVLVFCGFIGGDSTDSVQGIAVDAEGYTYLCGNSSSSVATFPVTVGPDLTPNGTLDAYILKLSPDGMQILYCGYIGGSGTEGAADISIDEQGRAYLAGTTHSTDGSFPVYIGPDLTANGGISEAWVARVSADGSALEYCGFIGGDEGTFGYGVDVDSLGRAYVAGHTRSDQRTFPVIGGPDLTQNGYLDGFIARVTADGTGLEYCGYIGGTEFDTCADVSVDSQFRAHVAGATKSRETSFPVKVGPDLNLNDRQDAYVAEVNADGTGLNYCGYIGGTQWDYCYNVAIDSEGCTYVIGHTRSNELSFPVKVGPDLKYNGEFDGYIAKVKADGTDLVYCGYIGGIEDDGVWDLAVDHLGAAYVFGFTNSTHVSFPVKGGPDLTFNGGDSDTFIAKVTPSGEELVYCGYIGGEGDEGATNMRVAIAVDPYCNAYVVGTTKSTNGFPVFLGPDLTYGGGKDGFVAKVSMALTADSQILSVVPGDSIDFTLHGGKDNVNRNYILLGSASGTSPGMLLPGGAAMLPLNYDAFMEIMLGLLNTTFFSNFLGTLDATSTGTAQLNTAGMPPFHPSSIGLQVHFAYALYYPWDFVSNAVMVEITP